MKASDWIVALVLLGCGGGIAGFWISRLATHKVALDQYVMRLHLAAEFLTSAALFAGGIATLVDARARTTVVIVGVSLGLLVYASVALFFVLPPLQD